MVCNYLFFFWRITAFFLSYPTKTTSTDSSISRWLIRLLPSLTALNAASFTILAQIGSTCSCGRSCNLIEIYVSFFIDFACTFRCFFRLNPEVPQVHVYQIYPVLTMPALMTPGLFVAANITTPSFPSNPSISESN